MKEAGRLMFWGCRNHPDLHRFSRKSHRTCTQYNKASIQSRTIVREWDKGRVEYPSIRFLCSALRGPLSKPYLQEWKHLSFYWAMCLCWETCLGFRVQGFYWTMVTKAPYIRSHNKWNFRLSEGKQVFNAPGRQNNLISVSTFQRQIFQTPPQGQYYK